MALSIDSSPIYFWEPGINCSYRHTTECSLRYRFRSQRRYRITSDTSKAILKVKIFWVLQDLNSDLQCDSQTLLPCPYEVNQTERAQLGMVLSLHYLLYFSKAFDAVTLQYLIARSSASWNGNGLMALTIHMARWLLDWKSQKERWRLLLWAVKLD